MDIVGKGLDSVGLTDVRDAPDPFVERANPVFDEDSKVPADDLATNAADSSSVR